MDARLEQWRADSTEAALFLAVDFDADLLNAANANLIGLQMPKSKKQVFIDYARSFFSAENNRESRFYELREKFNSSQKSSERSALFVYLNRPAFNGLCRYRSRPLFRRPERQQP